MQSFLKTLPKLGSCLYLGRFGAVFWWQSGSIWEILGQILLFFVSQTEKVRQILQFSMSQSGAIWEFHATSSVLKKKKKLRCEKKQKKQKVVRKRNLKAELEIKALHKATFPYVFLFFDADGPSNSSFLLLVFFVLPSSSAANEWKEWKKMKIK